MRMGSYRVGQAVRDTTKLLENADFGGYRILLALAERAFDDGTVGVTGDYQKCVGHSRIAKDARVHPNTVGNWIPKLVERGELIIKEQGGSGRGRWTVYQLPHVENHTFEQRTPYEAEADNDLLPQANDLLPQGNSTDSCLIELTQRIELLTQVIKLLPQENDLLPQAIATIATNVSHTGGRTKGNQELNQSKTKGGNQRQLPSPPDGISAITDSDNFQNEEWQQAVGLVGIWQRMTSSYANLSPDNDEHKADYFAPALLLVTTFKDFEAVKTAVSAGYDDMLRAGFTPRKLDPVARQIMAAKRREALPSAPAANGKNGTAVSKQAARMMANEAAINELFGD